MTLSDIRRREQSLRCKRHVGNDQKYKPSSGASHKIFKLAANKTSGLTNRVVLRKQPLKKHTQLLYWMWKTVMAHK